MEQSADTLILEIGFANGCCIQFSPKINLEGDTLAISYFALDGQSACACICCYQFSHKIAGLRTDKPIIKLFNKVIEQSDEKYRTYPISYVLRFGDTVNLKDKYGLKQGIWPRSHDRFVIYTDDEIAGTGEFYKGNKIKKEYGLYSKLTREYYKNGALKKEYRLEGRQQKVIRRWRRNGQQIK